MDKECAITDYAEDSGLKNDADEVLQNPAMDTDNFVFTTARAIIIFIKDKI